MSLMICGSSNAENARKRALAIAGRKFALEIVQCGSNLIEALFHLFLGSASRSSLTS